MPPEHKHDRHDQVLENDNIDYLPVGPNEDGSASIVVEP